MNETFPSKTGAMDGKPSRPSLAFLEGGGEMGSLIRAHDWSLSPLNSPVNWPQPLRTLVGIMLGSHQPMFVAWGPERIMLYNDGYAPLLGQHHPAALGVSFNEVWHDILDQVGPIMDRAYAGQSTHMDDLTLLMHRHGYSEVAHFSFSYTPVRDDDGEVVGMFCACTETTEQVKARAAEKAEKERFSELFQQAPSFMALLRGPHHVIEFANPGFIRLIGYRDVLGKTVREALPEVEGQGYFELLDEAYRTGEAFSGLSSPVRMPRAPEGEPEERFVDFVYQPITGADGTISGIFVEGHDVTERVHGEKELREREARFRQILNSASDYAILAQDMNGLITSWNEGARSVLGWVEDEVLGQPVDLFFTPEDVAARQPLKEMQAALNEGRAIDERWHQRKGGERFWASGELTPLKDDAGTITGFVKVMRDRTEHRRVEDTLRQYGVLVESMTEGVSLSNESGVIVYTNPAEDRMFGYAPGELIGQHVSGQNAYPPDENARRVEAVIAQLQASGSWDGEWRNRRKDGTEFITGSRITAVEIEGRPHWLCVQRDITRAKQAEEHQRLLINELNHRVKNTLATVQSIAGQTLRNAETTEEARSALESRLLALSRVHDVLTRENWDGADLRELVAEAVEPYSNPGEDRLHLSGETIRLPPRMALALAMALQELATNAVKYGALSNGTGEVRIEWSDGDDRLHLTWSETGGPPVKTPSRRGFGTRLIERSLASDLDGEVTIAFEPTGLICTVDAPLTRPEVPMST